MVNHFNLKAHLLCIILSPTMVCFYFILLRKWGIDANKQWSKWFQAHKISGSVSLSTHTHTHTNPNFIFNYKTTQVTQDLLTSNRSPLITHGVGLVYQHGLFWRHLYLSRGVCLRGDSTSNLQVADALYIGVVGHGIQLLWCSTE